MSPTTVLLVDDQEMLGDPLALRLSSVPGLVVLGRYSTREPALMREVQGLRPDVTTVDIEDLGSGTGPFVSRLLDAWPGGHVVVLSASKASSQAVAAARAGAAAWVDKASSVEELVEVLRGVGEGHAWYPSWHLGPVLRALLHDAQSV